jgi:hypothetical protein
VVELYYEVTIGHNPTRTAARHAGSASTAAYRGRSSTTCTAANHRLRCYSCANLERTVTRGFERISDAAASASACHAWLRAACVTAARWRRQAAWAGGRLHSWEPGGEALEGVRRGQRELHVERGRRDLAVEVGT